MGSFLLERYRALLLNSLCSLNFVSVRRKRGSLLLDEFPQRVKLGSLRNFSRKRRILVRTVGELNESSIIELQVSIL